MLNRSGERWRSRPVADLRGNAFNLSQGPIMSAVDFPHRTFIMLQLFPCIPSLLSVFIIKGC